ncbi:hypothetical protein [Streptomyces sp. NPDC055036]
MSLPDNLELLKLEAAGLSRAEIAKKFKVTHQAVSYRLGKIGEHKRISGVSKAISLLPWDLSQRDNKKKLAGQASFAGLRTLLRARLGEDVSDRAREDLRAFLNHVSTGKVLTLDDRLGFIYIPREEFDGNMVIRWPKRAPRTAENLRYFELPKHEELTRLMPT